MPHDPSSPRLAGAALAQALLEPRSVALLGASDDTANPPGLALKSLRAAGFRGKVYPVNPQAAKVQGEPAWPDLASLPEVPDQVLVLTSGRQAVEAVRAAAERGVKVATVLAGGLEAAAAHRDEEEALHDIAEATGIRVLGPGSHGVIHTAGAAVLSGHPSFTSRLPAGAVFVACQGGGMITSLVARGAARGVGFAGFVSAGSETDLTLGEVCAATLDDLRIEGYLLCLDTLRHAAALRTFCREAAARGKPVIAWKPARPATATAGGPSQVSALASEEDVADVFLKDLGVARVDLLESLLEAFPLANRLPLSDDGRQPRRVGILCTAANGPGAVVEALAARRLLVQPPSQEVLDTLADIDIAAAPGPVLQLTGASGDTLRKALTVMLESPEHDLVLAVLSSGGRFGPPLDVKPVVACADGARPLAVMLVPDAPEPMAALTRAGIACFRSPEVCADAIAAVCLRRPPGMQPATQEFSGAAARTLRDDEAFSLLDTLGVPRTPAVALRLSQPPGALPFPFPVTARVSSPRIPHKEEIGGIVRGIADAAQLAAALATLRRNLAARVPDVPCDHAVVHPARKGLTEVMLGYQVDPEAGPLVMLAAGGIWADVARDRSLRLAPVDARTARVMVSEVQALKSLPRGAVDALASAIAALSQLAVKPDLRVVEAEVSPLVVLPEGEGVQALDARILRE